MSRVVTPDLTRGVSLDALAHDDHPPRFASALDLQLILDRLAALAVGPAPVLPRKLRGHQALHVGGLAQAQQVGLAPALQRRLICFRTSASCVPSWTLGGPTRSPCRPDRAWSTGVANPKPGRMPTPASSRAAARNKNFRRACRPRPPELAQQGFLYETQAGPARCLRHGDKAPPRRPTAWCRAHQALSIKP